MAFAASASAIRSSLPVRGAWIEINLPGAERGLLHCRSPCGERGLKSYKWLYAAYVVSTSLPVRGAWIEIVRAMRLLPW